LSPFLPLQLRLHWVKGQDAPVSSLPVDSSYEAYTHLHSKAIEKRGHAPYGSCPYDMDVLYQFWSHFLVRNFNLQMYQEFRHFACEDSENRGSEVGLTNLINFYGESLLSTQNPIRESVARHFVDLVKSKKETHPPAYVQLRSAYCSGILHPRSRQLIQDLLDPELEGLLQ
jgi:la-related protein 1